MDKEITTLAQEWKRCGVQEGDVLLLHSNIRRLLIQHLRKKIKLSPEDILDSFLQAVGLSGTVIFPLFNFEFTQGVPFDVRKTPSHMGALTEAARVHPESVRTGNPIYSFAVIGKKAEMFEDVDNYSGYDEHSPFAMLRDLDGKIGVLDLPDQNSMTFYHHVEEMHKVPYRYLKEFKGEYIDKEGKSAERTYALYVRDIEKGVLTHVDPAGELMWNAGLYQGDRPGERSGLRTISARKMYDFVADIIESNRAKGLLYRVEGEKESQDE